MADFSSDDGGALTLPSARGESDPLMIDDILYFALKTHRNDLSAVKLAQHGSDFYGMKMTICIFVFSGTKEASTFGSRPSFSGLFLSKYLFAIVRHQCH